MLKGSKLNIAKQKIIELNKKYCKKNDKEHKSNETCKNVNGKSVVPTISSKQSSIESSDTFIENISVYNQSNEQLKLPKEINSTKSSVASNNSKIQSIHNLSEKDKLSPETLLNLNVDKVHVPEVQTVTPTGVSKLLANVFIISSSDEELSEDIDVGQVIDRVKSHTSTSARTVSEDIISEDGNKKITPRNIKFVRINTPILIVNKEDENMETTNSFNPTSEAFINNNSSIENNYKVNSSTCNSNTNSISITFKDSSSSDKEEENGSALSPQRRKLLKTNDFITDSVLINRNDNVTQNKTEKTFSKAIQTELLKPVHMNNKIKDNYNIHNKIKINAQNRPTLRTSTLYKFSTMSDTEINNFCSKVSNIYMDDLLEVDERSISLELIVQQLLKQQVKITRNFIENHHQLYLCYCKSVHHISK